MFQAETADRLNGYGHGIDNRFQFIEWIGHAFAASGDAATFVVANVMDDVVAAEVGEAFGAIDHVLAGKVVAHDFDAHVLAGLNDTANGFLVGLGHYDHLSGARFGHQLGL